MSESLINKGVAVVGSPQRDHAPIVVVGVARGGTSMVAGSLAHLGIFMGAQSSPPVFEDVRLSTLFEQKDFEGVQALAEQYTQKHGLWGWKRPSSVEYLADVDRLLNRPRYIFVYKDIMSIAQRNAISMLSELVSGMERPIRQYKKTLDFLKEKNPHAMLVSYDKAMSDPSHFVQILIEFSGVEPDDAQVQAALEFITPNPEHYLDSSRITKAQGRLGGVKDNKIYGWARFVHSKQPARVDLFVNDQKIGTAVADQPRPDLAEKFNQDCAFNFNLNSKDLLKIGDVLRARVIHEVIDLDNSPFVFED